MTYTATYCQACQDWACPDADAHNAQAIASAVDHRRGPVGSVPAR